MVDQSGGGAREVDSSEREVGNALVSKNCVYPLK